MTLIEVVAAIAIIGTVLVGVVLAKSRHTRQRELAARQQAAVAVADEMLADWYTSPAGLPYRGEGQVAGHYNLTWQLKPVENSGVQEIGGRAIRFTIHPTPGVADPSDQSSGPLITVDLVVAADTDDVKQGGK